MVNTCTSPVWDVQGGWRASGSPLGHHGMLQRQSRSGRVAPPTPSLSPPAPHPLHSQASHGSCRGSRNKREQDYREAAGPERGLWQEGVVQRGWSNLEQPARVQRRHVHRLGARGVGVDIFDDQAEIHYISLGLGTD